MSVVKPICSLFFIFIDLFFASHRPFNYYFSIRQWHYRSTKGLISSSTSLPCSGQQEMSGKTTSLCSLFSICCCCFLFNNSSFFDSFKFYSISNLTTRPPTHHWLKKVTSTTVGSRYFKNEGGHCLSTIIIIIIIIEVLIAILWPPVVNLEYKYPRAT